MKRSVSLLGILCLFVSFSVHAQYTNIQTWGQKLYYNGSDYPGTFLKLKVAVANPRISGTGGKVVFYDSESSQYNYIEVKGVYQSSDARLKTNITPLNSGLGTILGLKPVSYNWKSETSQLRSAEAVPSKAFGFLAQEVAEVMPEIVTLSSTGDSLVDYTAVIPVLVQAVKELDATIQQLELQLDEKANLSDLQNNKNLTSKSLLSNAVMNQNTPNPFNSTTNISFTIPTSARSAFISICNLQGTQVKKFDIATRGEGSIMVSFSDLGVAGMYMYSLVVDGQLISTKRMLLVQ